MEHAHRLRGARILITGGAGLIGSHVADLLVRAGAGEIVIFDNLSRGRVENLAEARAKGRITVVQDDIRDRAAIAEAMQGIDFLFHLAAIRLTECAGRTATRAGSDGGRQLQRSEAAVNAKVKRVAAASPRRSTEWPNASPTSEDHHPYHNTTLYGAAKVFNEGLLTSFRDMYGLDYIALRPFNVYGPRMDIHGAYTEVLVRWMERIANGKPPIIFGDGSQSMDFVFVADVARAFLLAASSDVSGEVFNIASGVETSLKELARALLHAMDSNLEIEYGPERKLTAVPRRIADVEQSQSAPRLPSGSESRPGSTAFSRLVA